MENWSLIKFCEKAVKEVEDNTIRIPKELVQQDVGIEVIDLTAFANSISGEVADEIEISSKDGELVFRYQEDHYCQANITWKYFEAEEKVAADGSPMIDQVGECDICEKKFIRRFKNPEIKEKS